MYGILNKFNLGYLSLHMGEIPRPLSKVQDSKNGGTLPKVDWSTSYYESLSHIILFIGIN